MVSPGWNCIKFAEGTQQTQKLTKQTTLLHLWQPLILGLFNIVSITFVCYNWQFCFCKVSKLFTAKLIFLKIAKVKNDFLHIWIATQCIYTDYRFQILNNIYKVQILNNPRFNLQAANKCWDHQEIFLQTFLTNSYQ